MDITNKNFLENLPRIKQSIIDCDFVAIDTELSGLFDQRSFPFMFDTPSERFASKVRQCKKYIIIQFGISCFRLESALSGDAANDTVKYSCQTYNFYIFPQPIEGLSLYEFDRTLSLQAGSAQFLIEHGFDFNRLIRDGVSYLNFDEDKKVEEALKAAIIVSANQSDDGTNKKHVNKKDASKQQQQLSASNNDDDDHNHQQQQQPKTKAELGSDAKMKFLKAHMQAKGFLLVLEYIIHNEKPLIGHNLLLDLIHIINQFIEPVDESYDSFKETCKTLFPVIYDTKYLASTAFPRDLIPSNQTSLGDLFNVLTHQQQQRHQEQQQDQDSQNTANGADSSTAVTGGGDRINDDFARIGVENSFEFRDDQELHQAGYDAYLSGYCFIVMCESYLRSKRGSKKRAKLMRKQQEQVQSTEEAMDVSSSTNDNAMDVNHGDNAQQQSNKPRLANLAFNHVIRSQFANKIFLTCSHDITAFDLDASEDKIPDRSHLFHIKCPRAWTNENLYTLFKNYGGVTVGWLSHQTQSITSVATSTESANVGSDGKTKYALCALRDPSKAPLLRRTLKTLKMTNFTITTYDEYLKNR